MTTQSYYIPIDIQKSEAEAYMVSTKQYDDSDYCEKISIPIQISEKAPFDNNCIVKGFTTLMGGKYYYTESSEKFIYQPKFKCFESEADAVADGYVKSADN